jgi:hypothetical protein
MAMSTSQTKELIIKDRIFRPGLGDAAGFVILCAIGTLFRYLTIPPES